MRLAQAASISAEPVYLQTLARQLRGWLDQCPPRPELGEADTGWSFADGGYLLFGARFGARDEIKGMVDCGPLGYLGIADHGHADALAITLSVAGEECLVDPGTWSYSQAPAWRDYFRGTSAHNTVRVDGVDQSVSGGRFMWLRKAQARIDRMPRSPGDFDFRGSHDGYLRLDDPVRHRRSVRFKDATLVVRDELAAKQAPGRPVLAFRPRVGAGAARCRRAGARAGVRDGTAGQR